MKKIMMSLVAILFATLVFSQKIIENPAYKFKKTSIYHIDKIELNEKETKLFVRGTNFPNTSLRFNKETFIKDDKTQKKYQIKEIENYKFGEKILVPESGFKTVVLVFPPLDKGVKKIDYKHAIFGISLAKSRTKEEAEALPKEISNWFDNELQKDTTTPLKEFTSENFFSKKPAKLIGYIKGYDKRSGFSTIMVYADNKITKEEEPVAIEVLPDGRFSSKIPVTNPKQTYLSINRILYLNFYIEPNKTTALVLDWEDFLEAKRLRDRNYIQKTVKFKGSLAKINEELFQFKPTEFDYRTARAKAKTETPTAYKKTELKNYNIDSIKLATYIRKNSLSKKASNILKKDLQLKYAIRFFDFIGNRKNKARKDTASTILKKPVPIDYYNFLQKIDFADYAIVATNEFKIFVNRFEFSEPLSIRPKRKTYTFKARKSFTEYLEEINYSISPEDKRLLDEKRSFSSKKEYENYKQKFSIEYNKHSKEYNKLYITPLKLKYEKAYKKDFAKQSLQKWILKDSVLENTLQLQKNVTYEIAKIRSLKFDLEQTESKYAHEYWDEFKKQITHPFLKAEGERILNKIHPIYKIEKNIENNGLNNFVAKAKVKQLPQGKATTVFKNIVDKHKGKILFVDFWATTCGPCLASIKRMKEIRKQYKNSKDIDFVFITSSIESPKRTYEKFISEQEMINTYRLNQDDFNYLRQLFSFNGIPQYIVLNKNGDVIDDDYTMYRFTETVDEIIAKNK